MKPQEFRASAALAAVFSVRLLGLFMIYPVFAAYAGTLAGANPYLIGEALGIYGLTQGLLQIPFGVLSDRSGRKIRRGLHGRASRRAWRIPSPIVVHPRRGASYGACLRIALRC